MFDSVRMRGLLGFAFVVALFLIAVIQFYRPVVKPDVAGLLAEARSALNLGDVQKAGGALDRILLADPENAEALIERSKLWSLIGDYDSALSDLRKVTASKTAKRSASTTSAAWTLEGSIQLQRHRARDAERCLLEAWKQDQGSIQPLDILLRLYVLQMRRIETRKVLELIETHRSLLLQEIVLYSDAGGSIIDEADAVEQLKQFLKADPEDESTAIALMRYYLASEKYVEAESLLASPSKSLSNCSDLVGLNALAKLRAGSQADSIQLMNSSSTIVPHGYWWWVAAGELTQAAKQHNLSASCFEQAVGQQREAGYARYKFGMALEASGQTVLAQKQLEIAAKIDQLHLLTGVITRMNEGPEKINAMLRIASLSRDLQFTKESLGWANLAVRMGGNNQASQRMLNDPAANQTISPIPVSAGNTQAATEDIERWLASTRNKNDASVQKNVKSSHSSAVRLADVHESAGIHFQYFNGSTGNKYLIEAMGGGVGVLDYDNDGWPDCYFPQGSQLPNDPNDYRYLDQLHRNIDGKSFVEVSRNARIIENGYSQGVAVGDINNDGFDDIVVANFGQSRMFINMGDGTFEDATFQWGLTTTDMSSSLALADLDSDGNLDLYVTNYVDGIRICRDTGGNISTCNPQNFSGVQDRLFHNSGDGHWIDVTEPSGLMTSDGKGLGVVVTDLDDDGLMDIYVANDTNPNFLFKNLGGLRFREMGLESGTALSPEGQAQAGMGIAAADLNGDLMTDLFVTNFYYESNNLYINHGGMNFSDEASAAGLSRPSKLVLGFGTQAEDLDLDGNLDLIVANGHIDDFSSRGEPWKMATQVFYNLGDGVFESCGPSAGDYFAGKYLGRGVASVDWNRDGKKDFVVIHQDRQLALLENRTPPSRDPLVIRLIGTRSNRNAIGTRVILTCDGKRYRRDLKGGDGYYCSNERTLCFNASMSLTNSLEIRWPSGLTQTLSLNGKVGELTILEQ